MKPYNLFTIGTVSLSLAWFDGWIGYYADTKNKTLYICPFFWVLITWKYGEIAAEVEEYDYLEARRPEDYGVMARMDMPTNIRKTNQILLIFHAVLPEEYIVVKEAYLKEVSTGYFVPLKEQE